jgi:hypothetical protein
MAVDEFEIYMMDKTIERLQSIRDEWMELHRKEYARDFIKRHQITPDHVEEAEAGIFVETFLRSLAKQSPLNRKPYLEWNGRIYETERMLAAGFIGPTDSPL